MPALLLGGGDAPLDVEGPQWDYFEENPEHLYRIMEEGFGPSPAEAAAIIGAADAEMVAAAEQAKKLEYYENYKAQEQAYYEQPGEYGGYDPLIAVAETYTGIVDDTVEYVTEGGEYIIEETLDLPEDIIAAGGEAGATIVEAAAVPLGALEKPLTSVGIGIAAVAALLLLRKK